MLLSTEPKVILPLSVFNLFWLSAGAKAKIHKSQTKALRCPDLES
jgi:hypothetical protein